MNSPRETRAKTRAGVRKRDSGAPLVDESDRRTPAMKTTPVRPLQRQSNAISANETADDHIHHIDATTVGDDTQVGDTHEDNPTEDPVPPKQSVTEEAENSRIVDKSPRKSLENEFEKNGINENQTSDTTTNAATQGNIEHSAAKQQKKQSSQIPPAKKIKRDNHVNSAFAMRQEKAERNKIARQQEENRRAWAKVENTKEPVLTNQCKIDGIPNWNQMHHIVQSEQAAEEFIIDQGIVKVPTHCPKCSKELGAPHKGKLRCRRTGCDGKDFSKSIYVTSFFGFFRIKKDDILMFLYHWLTGAKARQLSIIMGWSTQTLGTYTKAVQELVGTTLVSYDDRTYDAATSRWSLATVHRFLKDHRTNHRDHSVKTNFIGGKNIHVQIAALQFGTRVFVPQKEKFCADHRDGEIVHGPHAKAPWLFSALEVSPTHKFLCLVVPDRNPATLTTLMAQYIAPESILRWDYSHNWATVADILDFHKGYDYLYHPQSVLTAANQEGLLQQHSQHAPVTTETTAAMLSLHRNDDQHHWVNIWGDNNDEEEQYQPVTTNATTYGNHANRIHENQGGGEKKQISQTKNGKSVAPTPDAKHLHLFVVEGSSFMGTRRSAVTVQRRHNNVPIIEGCLFEFIWRMKHKANLWKGLLQTLTDVHYDTWSGPLRDRKICVK